MKSTHHDQKDEQYPKSLKTGWIIRAYPLKKAINEWAHKSTNQSELQHLLKINPGLRYISNQAGLVVV